MVSRYRKLGILAAVAIVGGLTIVGSTSIKEPLLDQHFVAYHPAILDTSPLEFTSSPTVIYNTIPLPSHSVSEKLRGSVSSGLYGVVRHVWETG